MEQKKGLSAGHLTMMALGSVIGGSFFIGSSVAINAAGPSVFISYVFAGILVYFILFALSEMTVASPEMGSFQAFASKELGQGTGFVVGWVYWTGLVLSMSSEATAIGMLLRQWFPNLSIPLIGSGLLIVVTLLNLLGADRLSKLESALASIKLLTIVFFIILAFTMIVGFFPGVAAVGTGVLTSEPIMPRGIGGIAGSLLLVVFAYAGFEVIGLAASEAENPKETVPKAIKYTVLSLVGLYILYIAVLLPLIPTAELNESTSPMVASLNRWGIGWAGTVINFVLITAIFSAMLAAIFGLGRMIRSLADEGLAPKWLKENTDIPFRGIIFSGISMILGLGLGLMFPRVYLFLVSAGGFALLFTYAVIIATHIRFRKRNGCPEGNCQLPGYPYTSWFSLVSIVVVLLSMPFIPGQGAGLVAGIVMVVAYAGIYSVLKSKINTNTNTNTNTSTSTSTSEGPGKNKKSSIGSLGTVMGYQSQVSTEFSEELAEETKKIQEKEEKMIKDT